MRIIPDKSIVPPGGWKYFQKETNYWIEGQSFLHLLSKVRAHRQANQLPLEPHWMVEVEESICAQLKERLGHDYCVDGIMGQPIVFPERKRKCCGG